MLYIMPFTLCTAVVSRVQAQQRLTSILPVTLLYTGAAMRGHVAVLAWITARYPALQCTTDAIDLAAIAGQELAVRWLNEHRSEGYTLWGLESAREQQYSSIVAYLEADAASAQSHCKQAVAAAAVTEDCDECDELDEDEPEQEAVAVAELHDLVCAEPVKQL
jgi:hypothetical protein